MSVEDELYLIEANPALLALVVAEITGRTDIPIRINNKAPTASTNFTDIVLTTKAIPKGITNQRQIRVCLNALVGHEAEHILITTRLLPEYEKWMRLPTPSHHIKLAWQIVNLIEDPRCDYAINAAWRRTFGQAIRYYNRVMRPIAEENARAGIAANPDDRLTAAVNIIISQACYDSEQPTRWFTQDRRVIEVVDKCVPIIKKLIYGRIEKEYVDGADAILNELLKLVSPYGQDAPDSKRIPTKQGGEFQGEVTEEEGSASPSTEPSAGTKKWVQKTGSTAGNEMPAPIPNADRYFRLSQRNADRVRRLLELLKRKTWAAKTWRERFQRHGTLMVSRVPLMYVASKAGRPLHNVYEQRHIISKQTEPVYFGVIVDVSGSMNFETSVDALTTLSDVAGKWLKDEEFALLIFGEGFQKIKSFVERYDIARARIGGINTALTSSTQMLGPLRAMHKLFNGIDNDSRRKVCIVVSDLMTASEAECREEINLMRDDEITSIVVGMGGCSMEKAKSWSELATYISDISKLPEMFAECWDFATRDINKRAVS